jgi:hypothetical protein
VTCEGRCPDEHCLVGCLRRAGPGLQTQANSDVLVAVDDDELLPLEELLPSSKAGEEVPLGDRRGRIEILPEDTAESRISLCI